MYMNMQKTKALLVTGKRLRKRMVQVSGKLEVKTDNAEIENVVNHKLLGIDEDLTHQVHVDELCINFLSDLASYAILAPHIQSHQDQSTIAIKYHYKIDAFDKFSAHDASVTNLSHHKYVGICFCDCADSIQF